MRSSLGAVSCYFSLDSEAGAQATIYTSALSIERSAKTVGKGTTVVADSRAQKRLGTAVRNSVGLGETGKLLLELCWFQIFLLRSFDKATRSLFFFFSRLGSACLPSFGTDLQINLRETQSQPQSTARLSHPPPTAVSLQGSTRAMLMFWLLVGVFFLSHR